jgi:hypothetical protein
LRPSQLSAIFNFPETQISNDLRDRRQTRELFVCEIADVRTGYVISSLDQLSFVITFSPFGPRRLDRPAATLWCRNMLSAFLSFGDASSLSSGFADRGRIDLWQKNSLLHGQRFVKAKLPGIVD